MSIVLEEEKRYKCTISNVTIYHHLQILSRLHQCYLSMVKKNTSLLISLFSLAYAYQI